MKRKPRKERLAIIVDRGTERAQAMQALYGEDGCDAIGRAYRAGLLGSGNEAKSLLDMARSIANAYWSAFAVGSIRSGIGGQSFGDAGAVDHEKIKRREEWLTASLRAVDAMGRPVRRAFDQLVIDVHPDCGPLWLDQLVFAERRQLPADIAHRSSLRAALDALEMLCG